MLHVTVSFFFVFSFCLSVDLINNKFEMRIEFEIAKAFIARAITAAAAAAASNCSITRTAATLAQNDNNSNNYSG